MQKDGRVLYLTEDDKANLYYNIPIANTTSLLLGTGTWTAPTLSEADLLESGSNTWQD